MALRSKVRGEIRGEWSDLAERLAGEAKSNEPFDSVWCVFDVDGRKNLASPVARAKQLGFDAAVSNPSFDIWVLWHYQECERYMTNTEIRRELKKHGMRDKNLPPDFPCHQAIDAVARVKHPVGEIPDNPGSGVWVLVQYLFGSKMSRS